MYINDFSIDVMGTDEPVRVHMDIDCSFVEAMQFRQMIESGRLNKMGYINYATGMSLTNNFCYTPRNTLKIKKVIFHDPATIVYWSDRSKTVVKCKDGDIYDKEKGLALCISKKFLEDDFHSTFREWIGE